MRGKLLYQCRNCSDIFKTIFVENVKVELSDIMNKDVGAGYAFMVHDCGKGYVGVADLIGAEGVTE